jgi:hypothetical protein
MNVIEAVVEVVKANEEMTAAMDTYDSWFESLVGKTITIEQKFKHKIRFVTAEIEEFEPGEGWLARDIETDDIFSVAFKDFVEGRAWGWPCTQANEEQHAPRGAGRAPKRTKSSTRLRAPTMKMLSHIK